MWVVMVVGWQSPPHYAKRHTANTVLISVICFVVRSGGGQSLPQSYLWNLTHRTEDNEVYFTQEMSVFFPAALEVV